MKQKIGLMVVVVLLATCLMSGFVFASTENAESPDLQNDSETTPFLDFSFIDDLMEAMTELMETMRSYMEQVQDMIPGVGSPETEEEPEPVEEPAPVEEPTPPETDTDGVPTAGVVEGWLADDEKDPLSRVRVVMNSRETMTDRNGFFFFEDVNFGSHELYLSDPNIHEEIFLTSFYIDESRPNYIVNLVVSLPEDETEEAVVSTVPLEEDTRGPTLLLLGIILILLIAVIALFLFKRNHIRIVDAKTGELIGKQKIVMRPKTKIDLTEVFEDAYNDAVRVQFLKPAIRKLSGCRILFLKDGKTVGEIDEYAGELEYLVKLPEIAEEEAPDAESTPPEPKESPNQSTGDADGSSDYNGK